MRRSYCYNCGEDLGEWDRRYSDQFDTCGKSECNRAVADDMAAARDAAHEQLDRDNGWGRW